MAEEAELVGGRMRERRLELKLKQREVAERIPGNVEGKDVSRWENGHHRPHSDTLSHIATALETTVADLLSGPMADRQERGPAPDPFATSPDSESETVRELRSEIAALRTELLAEIGKVREAQEALLRHQPPGERGGEASGN